MVSVCFTVSVTIIRKIIVLSLFCVELILFLHDMTFCVVTVTVRVTTSLGRSVTTSEDALLRSETLLLEETLRSGFSVEGYDCQSNQRGLDLDHLFVWNLSQ